MNPVASASLPGLPQPATGGRRSRGTTTTGGGGSRRPETIDADVTARSSESGSEERHASDVEAIHAALEQRQALSIRRAHRTLASELLASMLEEMGGLKLADPVGQFIDVFV